MDPFIGEIRAFAFNFPPHGWANCNGQLLNIVQNTALFAILGTTYGGDGKTTFALPNLQGRAAMNAGQGPGLTPRGLGEPAGSETVTLTAAQIPAHNHLVNTQNGNATAASPEGAYLAKGGSGSGPRFEAANTYSTQPPGIPMNAGAMQAAGGGQPHPNMQPYLAVNMCIALQGIFPPRS